jgi:hypothetical protein
MSDNPWTDAQVAQVLAGAIELVREIRSGRLERAVEITRGWSLDETNHSEGGGSKNGHSDPTCSAAVNGQRKDPTHALLMSMLETVESDVQDLVRMTRNVQPITGAQAHMLYKQENQAALTLAPCASIACPDQAPVGRRHCEACNDYLDRRPGIAQVPKDVIAARQRKRKHDEARRVGAPNHIGEVVA